MRDGRTTGQDFPDDGPMVIDCDDCAVRGPGCRDCVVSVLLGVPETLLADERAALEVLAEAGDIAFASALRADDRVLLSVSWPGGKRWLMVDPVGNEAPQALRIGERSEDPEISRMVEGVWSQALTRAKQLMDGELDLGAEGPGETPDPPAGPRRRWRRGQG